MVRGKTPKSFSTKPLWNHLEGRHPQHYKSVKSNTEESVDENDPPIPSTSNLAQQVKREIQPSLEMVIRKKQMWSLDDRRAADISKIICEMIALDAEPFALVEREGFGRLIRHLAPQYPLPSRTYFSQNVMPNIYEKLRSTIQQTLTRAAYISFTTDIWTATANNESFISLTAHCLSSENMQWEVYALETKHFPDSHTGYNISEVLNYALERWNVPNEKIHVIVRDNAANMIAGTNLMVAESVGCFIHSLQFVIHDAIFSQRGVVDILGKCRKIVTHFSHSSLACSKLKKIQDNSKLSTHKLIQDVSTRWNSTFYMLTRLHEQKQAVTAYASEYDIPTFTANQWNTVESIIRVLQPFEEITKQASADAEAIGYVIPAVATLNSYLSKRQKDAGILLLKQELQKALQNCFLSSESQGLNVQKSRPFVLATFLDPRYKTHFLQDASTARGWIISDLIAVSTKDLQETTNRTENLNAPPSISEVQADAHENIWKCFDEIANVSKSDEDSSLEETDSASKDDSERLEFERQPSDRSRKRIAAYNAEVDKYLAQPLLAREENPLLWWKLHAKEYPKLTPLVLKYLRAPPSSYIEDYCYPVIRPDSSAIRLFGRIVKNRPDRLDTG
ncbi:zinc finger BED domain-containing protein 4-like [Diprion similis]|uniref:zinc finger BED domain-containing protein 4-like n=1 Tax=Diprion similis TaxID=362088 RepID=UPI001EF78154|nr:zinc finger BED domain-containing protein 4-like [Diprion similis]